MICKTEQKNMTLNGGSISPITHKQQGGGREGEKRNIRQQIKLLTGKMTSARRTKALSQALYIWMTNKYGLLSICQIGDPYHSTFHRGVEVEGSSRCRCRKCHHGSACCAAGNTAPSILGKASSTGICNGTSHENGWVSVHLWVRRSYSVSTGIPLSIILL